MTTEANSLWRQLLGEQHAQELIQQAHADIEQRRKENKPLLDEHRGRPRKPANS